LRGFLKCRLPLLLACLFCCLPALAIMIRHDRKDQAYLVDEVAYPQFFHLQLRNQRKVCLATLLNPRWAITAGHCAEDTPLRETLGKGETWPVLIRGETYAVATLVLHPQYQNGKELEGVDLALLQLDREVTDARPARLNRETNEQGMVVNLLGWGYTGNGLSGRRANDGKMRRAENQIDSADRWLQLVFNDPRQKGSTALELEGVAGLGDSGGPAFTEVDGELLLLGVAIGELEGEGTDKRQGLYGASAIYERISSHLEWIDATLQTN
jgi:secreted trypsin-like serine protease